MSLRLDLSQTSEVVGTAYGQLMLSTIIMAKHNQILLSFFCQACELLSALYGETAYEAADAYYYYGKALLEMARAEAGVFGNALDGGKLEPYLFLCVLILLC